MTRRVLVGVLLLGSFIPALSFAAEPTITSIAPSNIRLNDKIEIYGSGFGYNVLGYGQVRIDGDQYYAEDKKLHVTNCTESDTKWTDTHITVIVYCIPQDNKFGPAGPLTLVVYTDQYTKSAEFPIVIRGICEVDKDCNWNFARPPTTTVPILPSTNPTIISISPSTARFKEDAIDIIGSGFGNNSSYKGTVTITDNNDHTTYLNIESWTDTKIRTTVDYLPLDAHDNPSGGTFSLSIHPVLGMGSNSSSLTVITNKCTHSLYSCGKFGECSQAGTMTRTCVKTYDCADDTTSSPETTFQCKYSPQTNTPTIPILPSTSSQTLPQNTTAPVTAQDLIIKSTVKLICPLDETLASQGSGTVIDSTGTILTNKHVVAGTVGCFVGFIDSYKNNPYFDNGRQIADVLKVSPNSDIAIVKLRNPQNKQLYFVDIRQAVSATLGLGDKLAVFGFPAKFGDKLTFTSGVFAGQDGDYLKTDAILEHGNSGGGAYNSNGTFIGIPSEVMKGELNSLGYILSVDTINAWLINAPALSSATSKNDYARVSALLKNFSLNGKSTGAAGTTQVFTRTLSIGSKGDDVSVLQGILVNTGFLSGSATGYFGKLTKKALMQYQTANGISPTGAAGPLTRAKLNATTPN